MKTKIFFLAVYLTLVAGCEKILIEKPFTFLAPESITTVEGAEAVVKAAYQRLSQGGALFGINYFSSLEYENDYEITRGTRYPQSIYNFDATALSRIQGHWGDIYSAINRANLIISDIPNIELSDNLKGQWISEAKVLRAFCYFHLVRGWGGVPLRLEPLRNLDNTSIARSEQIEVYNQIIKDLTEAINSGYLPENYPSSQLGRVSVHAARVLLADVYLTNKNWVEAATMAQEVISSGKFQLEPNMYKIFSPEDGTHSGYIWSLKYARINGIGSYIPNFMHGVGTGYSTYEWYTYIGIPSHPLLANWDNNDQRKKLNLYDTDPKTIEGKSLSAAVPMLFKKYIDKDYVGDTGHGNDFPLYRYADALLIFAEADCQAKNGPSIEAYNSVNQVRRRAYGVDINTPQSIDLGELTKEEFIDAIWKERAYEFMLEGKRLFDLRRMGFTIATQQINSSGDSRKSEFWGTENMLWPIPRQEIDNNDLITDADQNPGY